MDLVEQLLISSKNKLIKCNKSKHTLNGYSWIWYLLLKICVWKCVDWLASIVVLSKDWKNKKRRRNSLRTRFMMHLTTLLTIRNLKSQLFVFTSSMSLKKSKLNDRMILMLLKISKSNVVTFHRTLIICVLHKQRLTTSMRKQTNVSCNKTYHSSLKSIISSKRSTTTERT